MSRWLLENLAPFLIAPIYWFYSRLWSETVVGDAEVLRRFYHDREPCVYAHWHGDELVLIGHYSFRKLAVLSSLSKDGTIMARTLSLLGYRVFRGSSSRGGARGLLNLIRAVQDGAQSALAVDGPKGPIYEVKPGIVELAKRTGHEIVPVRVSCNRAWFIPRAWNKSYLPKPFAKVVVAYGKPISSAGETEIVCSQVKAALDSLQGK